MKPNPSSIPALERSPSHLLHRALQLALDIYAVETGPVSVTQRQYAVLAAVAADEGLSQTGLVRATGIDRSTLADLVGRMIAKGYLERARSAEDARANTVKLGEAGRAVLEAAGPRVAAADQRILQLLGGKKREPFVDALCKLARAGEGGLLPEPQDTPARTPKKSKKNAKKKKKLKLREAKLDAQSPAPAAPQDAAAVDAPASAEPLDLDVEQRTGP